MGFSSWLYTDSTKNLRVKIVHPGGHSELHERPVLAAEIIRRNPRCCVAHPNVFKQPWAIVQPDTMLMPGQKFYIVPIATIRKLQMISLKHPSSQIEEVQTCQSSKNEGGDDGLGSPCWLIANTPKLPAASACLKSSGKLGVKKESSSCFTRMVKGSNNDSGSGSWGCSETITLAKKRAKDENKGGSPKRLASLDYWQPDLQSVNEE